VQPKQPTLYNGDETSDLASEVDQGTAQWEFHERINGRDVVKTRQGLRVTYTWRAAGPAARAVVFSVKDRAGNESMYRFTTVVQDTVPPDVSFSLQPPLPGAHRLRVVVKASESVRLRLLVTQVGRHRPLLRRTVAFWGDSSRRRSIVLNAGVGRSLLVVGGIARDLAGNATPLPQCVVDPVTGQGSCTPL
jgi:hypothetical protein